MLTDNQLLETKVKEHALALKGYCKGRSCEHCLFSDNRTNCTLRNTWPADWNEAEDGWMLGLLDKIVL